MAGIRIMSAVFHQIFFFNKPDYLVNIIVPIVTNPDFNIAANVNFINNSMIVSTPFCTRV